MANCLRQFATLIHQSTLLRIRAHIQLYPHLEKDMISLRFATASTLGALVLAACGGSGSSSTATTTQQPVEIAFDVTAAGQTVACGQPLTNLGTTAASGKIQDLRFYVSNVSLLDDKGNKVPVTLTKNDYQNYNVTLLDFEDGTSECSKNGTAAINKKVVGTVPSGNYTGVAVTVGVPVKYVGSDNVAVALNHSNYATATTPLDIQGMAWSWQAGRKFTKIEFMTDGGSLKPDGTTASAWTVHLGSTGCSPDPTKNDPTTVTCTSPNRMDFSFSSFNASTQKIVLDLAGLYSSANLKVENGGAAGCMSGATDPECTPIFDAMQIKLTPGAADTGLPINGGAQQRVFKVQSK
jgi:uncharacterized repeat protein (TIGR04052 family)